MRFFDDVPNIMYFCSMNARKDKIKASRAQLNQQLLHEEDKQVKTQSTWKENLGKYLIDISKYVVTGVVIASLFQDVTDKTLIYALGVVIALSTLISGLILTNKKKEEK